VSQKQKHYADSCTWNSESVLFACLSAGRRASTAAEEKHRHSQQFYGASEGRESAGSNVDQQWTAGRADH